MRPIRPLVLLLSAILYFYRAGAQPAPQDNWAFERSFGGISSGGNFHSPHSVVVAPDGSLVVSDAEAHRIQVFSADGTFLRKFGSPGEGDGQFRVPVGVAVAPDGSIIVADSGNNRIQVFSPEGVFLRKQGSPGSGDGQFSGPKGVAVAPDGAIIVADTGNYRIQVLGADGQFIRKFGSYGLENGQFGNARSVAVASEGTIVVGDSLWERIQVFGADGTFLRRFGSGGTSDGQFKSAYPDGMSVSAAADGSILVADAGNDRIQVFSGDGTFIRKFGFGGAGADQIDCPTGIALTPTGQVVITDNGNARLQCFSADGSFLRSIGRWGAVQDGFGWLAGMDFGPDGHLYLLDSTDNSVQVFDRNGVFQRRISTGRDGNPQSLTVGPDGRIFIADGVEVHVFDNSGTPLYRLGQSYAGSADGQFGTANDDRPLRVAVSDDGEIFVADPSNSRVQVFSAVGTFLRKFGEPGTASGQTGSVSGIAFTPDGRVALATARDNALQVFTKLGVFSEEITYSGWNPSGASIRITIDGLVVRSWNGTLASIHGGGALGGVSGNNCATAFENGTGALFCVSASATPRSIDVYRRTFRTAGATPPRLVPQPYVRNVAQRAAGELIDLDYCVVDGDSPTVSVAVAAFRNGSSIIRDLVPLRPSALVESTADRIGSSQATNTVHRLTWDAGVEGVPSGNLVFEVFARDERPGLLDLEFVTLPGEPALTISRIPVTHADLRAVWAWLILTGDPELARTAEGEISGPTGTFTNSYQNESRDIFGNLVKAEGTDTTPAGRAWLFAKIGVREATAEELDRARKAASGTINRFVPDRKQQIGGRPKAVNEWTFDTSDQYEAGACWVVPLP